MNRNLLEPDRHRRAHQSARMLSTIDQDFYSIQFLDPDEVLPVPLNADEVPAHVELITMAVFQLDHHQYELNLWPISIN